MDLTGILILIIVPVSIVEVTSKVPLILFVRSAIDVKPKPVRSFSGLNPTPSSLIVTVVKS